MPTLDTSNWPESRDVFALSTGELNAYVTNGTNQWSLMESNARRTSGNDRTWDVGFTIVNHNFETHGTGKSVRPPQRFTIPLTGGGHMHFIPDMTAVEL